MARRRMYLFERAYVQYGARLRRFVRRALDAASGLWEWFWRGRGAEGIEMLLRLLLVGTALTLAVLYVRYEKAQGQKISAGTVGAVAVLLVFTALLLWGWKAPLHATARLASGATAAGLVLILGLAVAASATLVFSVYFGVLLALTAASLLLFLPLRGAQEAWLLYRRVTYRCPYDKCGWRGLPIHVCPCGERYPDLLPSFYGIFHHTCRHQDGTQQKLPTLDVLGRNRLQRLCGGCRRPLIHSSLGDVPVWPVAVVGGAGAGKTVFLLQATRQLERRLAEWRGTARIDSEAQEADFRSQVSRLDRGEVVAKTAEAAQAIGLAVRIPPRRRGLLYLFDAPGEDFASMRDFGQKQIVRHLRGIVLLVDPFSLPALSVYAERSGSALQPSQTPLRDVVHNLIQSVNLMVLRNPHDRCDIPTAVVLSKADALPERDHPFLAGLCPANGHRADEALSARCREALEQLGEGASVRALEQKLTRLRYFACTALGRLPDLRDTRPFEPHGVAEPLLWLLDASESERGKRS
jgi:hypothetical protein